MGSQDLKSERSLTQVEQECMPLVNLEARDRSASLGPSRIPINTGTGKMEHAVTYDSSGEV
jgi:hypothetical protein